MSAPRIATAEDAPVDRLREALARIETALRGLSYGTVTAVVQDGVVVQVDRTEKIRIERGRTRGSP
jgi:hypothetical protein